MTNTRNYENIRKIFLADKENTRNERTFYIENGFFPSWAEEHRNDPNKGIKAYLTELMWDKYRNGEITREEAIKKAVKRMNKQLEKEISKGIARIEAVENANISSFINVSIEWVRSSTWGYNPHAEVNTEKSTFCGSASGCGYDKESSAIASAFNLDNSVLKVLFELQEEAIKNGKTPHSKTACTGFDNRYSIGYGAGYNILPYFEGGVGVSCFISILEKAGYKTRFNHGKHCDFYSFYLAD
jgi:hypothetical protein